MFWTSSCLTLCMLIPKSTSNPSLLIYIFIQHVYLQFIRGAFSFTKQLVSRYKCLFFCFEWGYGIVFIGVYSSAGFQERIHESKCFKTPFILHWLVTAYKFLGWQFFALEHRLHYSVFIICYEIWNHSKSLILGFFESL